MLTGACLCAWPACYLPCVCFCVGLCQPHCCLSDDQGASITPSRARSATQHPQGMSMIWAHTAQVRVTAMSTMPASAVMGRLNAPMCPHTGQYASVLLCEMRKLSKWRKNVRVWVGGQGFQGSWAGLGRQTDLRAPSLGLRPCACESHMCACESHMWTHVLPQRS